MRIPRTVRIASAILILILVAIIGGTAGNYFLAALNESSESRRSGYLGTVFGAVGLILPALVGVHRLVGGPPEEELFKRIRRRQASELLQRLNALRLHQTEDVELAFEDRSTAEGFDLSAVLGRISDGQRVVLLGAPGAGKSYSMAQLALRVIREPSLPIPLIIPISRWRPGADMAGWLASYTAREFRISLTSAADLVKSGRILPMFDSLEEVHAPRGALRPVAETFLDTLLERRELEGPAPFVLAAQTLAWRGLPERYRLHHTLTTVSVKPVDEKRAVSYLARSLFGVDDAARAQVLVEAIGTGTDGDALSLPWRLAMIARAAKPLVLPDGRLGSRSQAELAPLGEPAKLVEAFVMACAFGSKGRRGRARDAADFRCLSFIARYLVENGVDDGRSAYGRLLPSRDIEIHRMWPIAGLLRPRVADLLLCVALSIPGFVWAFAVLWGRGAVARAFLVAGGLAWVVLLVRTSRKPWVPAANPGRRRISEPRYLLRQLGAAVLLAGGATFVFSPLVALGVFVTSWVMIGLTVGFGQTLTTDSDMEIVNPVTTLRHERHISRLSAWAFFPLFAAGLSTSIPVLWAMGISALYCLVVGQTVASALWRRYVAMVVSSPRALSLSPIGVLQRAQRHGLVRSVGLTYQFRHDKVRDFLSSRVGGKISPTP